MIDPILDTDASARHCQVSKSSLEQMRCYGGGPVFIRLTRPGRSRGRIVYRLSDLDAWLNEHRRKSTSDPGGNLDGQDQPEHPRGHPQIEDRRSRQPHDRAGAHDRGRTEGPGDA